MSTAKIEIQNECRWGFSALGRKRRKKKTLYLQGMLRSFGPCFCCQITYILSLITKVMLWWVCPGMLESNVLSSTFNVFCVYPLLAFVVLHEGSGILWALTSQIDLNVFFPFTQVNLYPKLVIYFLFFAGVSRAGRGMP